MFEIDYFVSFCRTQKKYFLSILIKIFVINFTV